MKNRFLYATAACLLLLISIAPTRAADPDRVKGIIAEYCSLCHLVPGFHNKRHNPDIEAPAFQEIADNMEAYADQELESFLKQPHFPMRQLILSKKDIEELVAFIYTLRKPHDEPKP